jgi:hypothetical protein
MFRELSQTRITFVCGHCAHEWVTDYEIRHVEDGHGHSADYYARNGLPAVSPLAIGGVSCPECGALHLAQHAVTVHLTPTSAAEPVPGVSGRPGT